MSMMLCIDAAQLRKALAEIEAAEKNGFHYCLAVFRIAAVGTMLSDCRASYNDLWVRAHPTDGNFDWGRYQGVTRANRFVDGKLVPIKSIQDAVKRPKPKQKRAIKK
jgi:hypothetical protein